LQKIYNPVTVPVLVQKILSIRNIKSIAFSMISFLDYDIEKCYLMYAALLVFVSVLHQQNSLEDFCRKFSTKAESINW
jgi:hypothetical protein